MANYCAKKARGSVSVGSPLHERDGIEVRFKQAFYEPE